MSPASVWERHRWLRIATWAALLVTALIYGHICVVKGGDFHAFYDAAEAARLRGDIYAPGVRTHMQTAYVPYYSLILSPLTLLDRYAAAWIWFVLKVGAMIFLVRWVAGVIRERAPGAPHRVVVACVVLPFLIAFNPFNGDFHLGQANIFVLLFTVLTVRALWRGSTWPAAFFFSLAVVKVTALALVPWFVLRRQWRFLFASVGVFLGWLAVLAAWWGPTRIPALFVRWVTSTADARTGIGAVAYFENQSLQGLSARLAGVFPGLLQPVLGLPAYQWLWIVPCLALLALLGIAVVRDRFRARLPLEEFAYCSLLMLLASADSRWAHHVQLLVPLAVVTALAARLRLLQGLPRFGAWLANGEPAAPPDPAVQPLRRTVKLLLVAGLVILVGFGRDVVGKPAEHAVRTWGFHTAVDLALVAFLLRRMLGRSPGLQEETSAAVPTPARPSTGT